VETEPASVPADPGPGGRMVMLTYNTVLFGGMVVVGLLFMAYAIGLHVGKGSAPAGEPVAEVIRPPAPTPVRPLPPPPVSTPTPPLARKEYTIRLGDGKHVTAQDRQQIN